MNDLVAKFKALSMGSRIIVVAAIVLFVTGFFPWYTASASAFGYTVSFSENGWHSWSIIAIIVGLAMGGVIVIQNLVVPNPLPANVGGFSWPKIMLGAAVVTAVCVFIKLVSGPTGASNGFGLWLGFIAVAALVVGAFLDFQAERSGAQSSSAPQ